jgi:hypothetical protein
VLEVADPRVARGDERELAGAAHGLVVAHVGRAKSCSRLFNPSKGGAMSLKRRPNDGVDDRVNLERFF